MIEKAFIYITVHDDLARFFFYLQILGVFEKMKTAHQEITLHF